MTERTSQTNPYTSLPSNRFWKNAVADAAQGALPELWHPKFSITRESRICTVGSCFAQHISSRLIREGFQWLDGESAPAGMPPEEQRNNGYGVFSFRTGNIYTPALLKQWIDLSLGKDSITDEIFSDGERFYDPLRPNIPSAGFASHEEMLQARQETCQAILSVLSRTDIFIFTLGLTEAWRHRNGHVYPVCPGTVRGRFCEETHLFHNYTYDETVTALTDAFASIRAINPNVKFLLTVSPVPLTATAESQHVVSATSYSKAVLRAAAGFLAQTNLDVDYFPSFELISSPLFGGSFFESNRRSVNETGVNFVMGHFLKALGITDEKSPVVPASVLPPEEGDGSAKPKSEAQICEDLILEQWARPRTYSASAPPKILLVGDSQMPLLAKILDEEELPYFGGGIILGPDWHHRFFSFNRGSFFIPSKQADRERWLETLALANPARAGVPDGNKYTVIINAGAQTRPLFLNFGPFLTHKYGHIPQELTMHDVRSYVINERSMHFEVVKEFVDAGHDVFVLSDPPLEDSFEYLFIAFEDILNEFFVAAGATVLHARKWFAENGGFNAPIFHTDDAEAPGQIDLVHGNPLYYRTIFNHLIRPILKP